jgi:hypothetical protein
MLRFLENRTKPLVSELPCTGPVGGTGVCGLSVCGLTPDWLCVAWQIWLGDLNVSHQDMDVSHPSFFANQKSDKLPCPSDRRYRGQPGFTPIERERFTEMLSRGRLVDIHRWVACCNAFFPLVGGCVRSHCYVRQALESRR